MKLSKLLNLLLVVVLCVGAVSCNGILNGKPKYYTGPTKLELAPLSAVAGQSGTLSVNVQLFGKQRNSDLAVNFSVDDSSTAVQGQDFTLGTQSPITIPADSSSVPIIINVDNSNIASGNVKTLYLSLNGSDSGVKPAVNLKTYQLTIRGPQ